jgi:predicted nucleic acid-binding protein
MEHQRRNPNPYSPQTVLVDSDAFVALVKEDDANHARALDTIHRLKQEKAQLFTSNYVFSEAVTVISQRVTHEDALKFIQLLRSPLSPFVIKRVTEEVEELAIEIFERQTSKNTSFVDCTNMALMDYFRVDRVFSFDVAYRKNGYQLIRPPHFART